MEEGCVHPFRSVFFERGYYGFVISFGEVSVDVLEEVRGDHVWCLCRI